MEHIRVVSGRLNLMAIVALVLLGVVAVGEGQVAAAESLVPLRINEVLASNGSSGSDPQGDLDDWIEIVNLSAEPLDAAGLTLTDDLEEPTQWQIPTNDASLTTIPGHGYLLIWLDGDEAAPGLHANFKLSAGGERVALFDAQGLQIDRVAFGTQTRDVSYGRVPDGGGEWRLLATPTPGRANGDAALGVLASVAFSHPRGFYEQTFAVELSSATEDVTIVYTVDGREPGRSSAPSAGGRLRNPDADYYEGEIYRGPITIATTTDPPTYHSPPGCGRRCGG